MNSNQGNLSGDIIESARSYLSDYRMVNPGQFQEGALGLLDLNRAEYQLTSIEHDLGIKLGGNIKLLEVGSGLGSFLMVAAIRGIDCYGIEPNEVGVETAIKRMPELRDRIKIGFGESLPYESERFDLVVSFQVLEHTANPRQILKESIRVLKRGGFLYFVIPNYNSFWEGHYGLYWLPHFPRPLAKLYVRLLGREPEFLDGIQYITPKSISRILLDEDVELIDLGLKTWERRLDSLDFPMWGSTGKLMRLAKLARTLKVISLVKFLGKNFDLYYPIILVVKKN